MEEEEILNRLERKALKGKATQRELYLLIEAYNMHHIKIPKKIMEQI